MRTTGAQMNFWMFLDKNLWHITIVILVIFMLLDVKVRVDWTKRPKKEEKREDSTQAKQ